MSDRRRGFDLGSRRRRIAGHRPHLCDQGRNTDPVCVAERARCCRNDVTEVVKEFYEQTPFPNYDGLDTRDSLRKKARASVAAQLLNDQIPDTARILEVGCGTGQMTNFLAMAWGRTVIGSDICHNSLKLAAGFRDRFSINNAHFVQMNLFDPFFREHRFDVVISNGVLHHTGDAAARVSVDPAPGEARRLHRHRALQLARPACRRCGCARWSICSATLPRCWIAECGASMISAVARLG